MASALFACAGPGPGSPSAAFALVSIQVGGVAPDLARVEKTLEAMSGVLEVQIDAREARVDVAYDPARATREGLLAAIQGLGYEAEAVFRRAAPVPPPEESTAPPPGATPTAGTSTP